MSYRNPKQVVDTQSGQHIRNMMKTVTESAVNVIKTRQAALEKRQNQLGIVVERIVGVGRQGGDAFLMRRAKQNPKKNGVLPVKHGGRFASPSYVHDDPSGVEEESHNERKQSRDDYDESVKAYMRKNLNRLWKWDTNFKEGADGVKEKAMLKKAKAHAKKEVGAPKSCNIDCLYCAREQWKKNPSPLMRIPKIVLADMITPRMLDSKSQIFLFGDNEQREGKGGQAKVMRGHAKAYGIRTKRAPSMSESAFWTDKTYKSNIKMMADDFLAAFMAASDGDHELVIPSAGIGTGMAQLKQRAPKTYKWLNSFLRNLIAGEDPALLKQWRMN